MNVSMQTAPVTSEDRMWAALAWLPAIGWLFALLVLLMENNRNRPFQRFHAVNALGVAIVLAVLNVVLSFLVVGLVVSCPLSLAALAYQVYMAVQAYQGQWKEVPWLTQFARQQGWL